MPDQSQVSDSREQLLEVLFQEQRSLTAVERFSRRHSADDLASQARRYRDLIPLNAPGKGGQYAFEVDLDRCSGCKSCVTACHSLNGLDEDESWRSVGRLVINPESDIRDPKEDRRPNSELNGESTSSPSSSNPRPCSGRTSDFGFDPGFYQHVTTACHHCVDPACLNGCPVLAYEKEEATGIVRHLDDQCIGCQYCVLTCPYEVPRYSARRGIVRKCDLCSQRLRRNEAPACAQACPNEAIRITLIHTEEVVARSGAGSRLVPTAPGSALTLPTTRYMSRRAGVGSAVDGGADRYEAGEVKADEAGEPRLQPAHWPLVWMLVLTQAAAGLFVFAAATRLASLPGEIGRSSAAAGFVFLLGGLAASLLHLGRPLQAWRAFLGWRKSWLSREVIAFGLLAGCAGFLILGNETAPIPGMGWRGQSSATFMLSFMTAGGGLGAVFCSAMVYIATRRELWGAAQTLPRFFGSALVLGLSGGIAVGAAVIHALSLPGQAFQDVLRVLCGLLIAGTLLKLAREAFFLWRALRLDTDGCAFKTAKRMVSRKRMATVMRFALGTAGGIVAPGLLAGMSGGALPAAAVAGFLMLLAGELIERGLFFTTVVFPRMPGGGNR